MGWLSRTSSCTCLIAKGNEAVGEVLGDVVPTPLLDLATFPLALAGFTASYGLERFAEAIMKKQSSPSVRRHDK